MDRTGWARDLAEQLLAEQLPRRWAHVRGVARKAESVAHILGDDGHILVCAAWLHDVGYSPHLIVSGLHSLDGARYLRDTQGADERVCCLVAYHSCATIEARNRGLLRQLVDEFALGDELPHDVLTYCDMTTSPDGRAVTVEERLDEIVSRYGEGDLVARSIVEARPLIMRSVRAVAVAIR